MPRSSNTKAPARFRPRELELEGQAYTVVWDGRRGAPSLLPSVRPGGLDYAHEYELPRARPAREAA